MPVNVVPLKGEALQHWLEDHMGWPRGALDRDKVAALDYANHPLLKLLKRGGARTMSDSDGIEAVIRSWVNVQPPIEARIALPEETEMTTLTDDEEKSLTLVARVRACMAEEAKAREAVNAALKGNTTAEQREKAGVAHRDAQQATADARVALIDHAKAGAR